MKDLFPGKEVMDAKGPGIAPDLNDREPGSSKKSSQALRRKVGEVSWTKMPPIFSCQPGRQAVNIRSHQTKDACGLKNFMSLSKGRKRQGSMLDEIDQRHCREKIVFEPDFLNKTLMEANSVFLRS